MKRAWVADDDGEGAFVCFQFANGKRGSPHDDSMPVYLPKDPETRRRAAEAIARALNRAGIHAPQVGGKGRP